MDKEKFLQSGLIEQYILGLTNEEETAKVEDYALTFPEIAQEIENMRGELDHYVMQYLSLPPEELRSKVAHATDEDSHKPQPAQHITMVAPSRKSSILLWTLIAALAAFTFMAYKGKLNTEHKLEKMAIAFAAFRADCENQKSELDSQGKIYALLQHSATRPIELKGSQLAPDATAIAYHNPVASKVLLNLTQLPTPPSGKTYQLWADVEGEMINMGVIDYSMDDFQEVKFIEHAESYNLTLEPTGGSQKPTVELLYLNGEV